MFQGKYAEAEGLCAKAMEIFEETLGSGHPNVASAVNNRAALLRMQVRKVHRYQSFHGVLLSGPRGELDSSGVLCMMEQVGISPLPLG